MMLLALIFQANLFAANIYTISHSMTGQLIGYTPQDSESKYYNTQLAERLSKSLGTKFAAHSPSANFKGNDVSVTRLAKRNMNELNKIVVKTELYTVKVGDDYVLRAIHSMINIQSGRILGSWEDSVKIPANQVSKPQCMKVYDRSATLCSQEVINDPNALPYSCNLEKEMQMPVLACMKNQVDQLLEKSSAGLTERIERYISDLERPPKKPPIECVSNASTDNRERLKLTINEALDDFTPVSSLTEITLVNDITKKEKERFAPTTATCEIDKRGNISLKLTDKDSGKSIGDFSIPNKKNIRLKNVSVDNRLRNMTCNYNDVNGLRDACRRANMFFSEKTQRLEKGRQSTGAN